MGMFKDRDIERRESQNLSGQKLKERIARFVVRDIASDYHRTHSLNETCRTFTRPIMLDDIKSRAYRT